MRRYGNAAYAQWLGPETPIEPTRLQPTPELLLGGLQFPTEPRVWLRPQVTAALAHGFPPFAMEVRCASHRGGRC